MYQNTLEQLNQAQHGQKEYNKILVTSLTLTPNTLERLFLGVVGQTKDIQLDDTMQEWFQQQINEEKQMNIIALDFIFGCQEYCQRLLNFVTAID
jgi:hypothetical protein